MSHMFASTVADRAEHLDVLANPGIVAGLLDGAVLRCQPDGTIVGGWRADLAAHRACVGTRSSRSGAAGRALRDDVAAVALTGRGGGQFPTAIKWGPAFDAGPGGTVVVNAAEGEPASRKDAALLQYRPHLVLDGAADLAEAIAAREVIVWVHVDAMATRVSLRQAIAERRAANLVEPPIRVLLAPAGYVSGEGSAVIAGVRGGNVAPTFVADPARPWGAGPAVVVHNAETLARVGHLSRVGVDRYVASYLVTVSRAGRPGQELDQVVLDVTPRTPLVDVLRAAGVGQPAGVLIGGYAGVWRDWRAVCDHSIERLQQEGIAWGPGIVIALPESRSLMGTATAIAAFLAAESAQQCGPCMFGLPRLVDALRRARVEEAEALAEIIEGRGGCRLPDGAVRMVRSAIELAGQWRGEGRC